MKKKESKQQDNSSPDFFSSSQLCWNTNTQYLFDSISGISNEQKKQLVKNLLYVQEKHKKKNDNNSKIIEHFINLCNYKDNKVPDFQSIESEIRKILEEKYPD
jgi:uncharacterized protein YejL (UPF0352 family)